MGERQMDQDARTRRRMSLVSDTEARPFVEVTIEHAGGSRLRVANVHGSALAKLDVIDGDQVVLINRRRAAPGDLVVLPLSAVRFPFGLQNVLGRGSRPDDPLTLWQVDPEANRLRLSNGSDDPAWDGTVSAPLDAPLSGVVIGVVRTT